jgi:hypothetical protein
MSKNKGFDIIEEAHERANHNYHTTYWFNRVTTFTIAQWKAGKYFAPFVFIIITSFGLLRLDALSQTALLENKSLWSLLFDFNDLEKSASPPNTFLLFLFWIVSGIGTVQNIVQGVYSAVSKSTPKRRKEKKKKLPKRPKNYR